jgi:hypothetical protein
MRVSAPSTKSRKISSKSYAAMRQPVVGQLIQAQMGHVSPAMMKTYSHVRRIALDAAAEALEPPHVEEPSSVTSQAKSQDDAQVVEGAEFASEFGSPHWTISATG